MISCILHTQPCTEILGEGAESVSFSGQRAICHAKNNVIVERMGEIIAVDPERCPQRLCT